MERSLKQSIDEFHLERKQLVERSQIEHESSHNEISKLQRALELKLREINKVKKLGKTILEQRTELESFFFDALINVKKQIGYHQQDTLTAFRNSTGHSLTQDLSTYGLLQDVDEANRW